MVAFFQFTATFAQCADPDKHPATCVKNGDGQMMKIDLKAALDKLPCKDKLKTFFDDNIKHAVNCETHARAKMLTRALGSFQVLRRSLSQQPISTSQRCPRRTRSKRSSKA